MYCSCCHRQIFYRDLDNHGWCENCRHVVDVSPCKVSYWCVATVLVMPWLMPLGI